VSASEVSPIKGVKIDMVTYLHFTINSIATVKLSSRSTVVTPASTSLSVGTITGHVSCVAANTTDDAGGVVLTLGTVVLAVANLATVLAGLVLIISESTVEGGQFSQLIALQLILAFRD
jgi:hypothetical protein